MIQVSYLEGLIETFMILTFKGNVSPYSWPGSGGQGSSLHGSTKIGSPLHGVPSSVIGGIHFLCKVLVPPPHFNVQVDQSYKGTQ